MAQASEQFHGETVELLPACDEQRWKTITGDQHRKIGQPKTRWTDACHRYLTDSGREYRHGDGGKEDHTGDPTRREKPRGNKNTMTVFYVGLLVNLSYVSK